MEQNELDLHHSTLNMVSFGFGSLSREYLRIAFSAYAFFYYETEIGLDSWMVALSFILFAVYNMFNDPIIGYLTNKPFKFTKKWGRRFIWILLGGLPWGLTYILIFTPPSTNVASDAWLIFFWLLFTTCLFDTFHSLMFVSYQSLFTEKFRSLPKRRKAATIQVLIGVFGVALGAIVPPLFITFKSLSTYVTQGIVTFIIVTIGILLTIPGIKEDQETIDIYLNSYNRDAKRESFFKTLAIAVKQKPFISFMVMYALYQSLIETMQASIPYVIRFSLGRPASAATLVFAAFLVGVLISAPFWSRIANKVNDNRKIMLISAILVATTTLPLLFLRDYWLIILSMFIWGLALGGFWIMIFPVSADVVDNSIALTKKREEGIYTGFQQFFGRLGIVAQALTFAIVHTITGFDENFITPDAIWGIHIHTGLVPAIFLFIGALCFWKWYDLDREKVLENKRKIKEYGL